MNAHWIFDHSDGFYRCSNCNCLIYSPHHSVRSYYNRYCGVCGALMQAEEENEDKQLEKEQE